MAHAFPVLYTVLHGVLVRTGHCTLTVALEWLNDAEATQTE